MFGIVAAMQSAAIELEIAKKIDEDFESTISCLPEERKAELRAQRMIAIASRPRCACQSQTSTPSVGAFALGFIAGELL